FLPLPGFLVLTASLSHGGRFGNLCDGDIPPGFIAADALIDSRLYHNHGRLGSLTRIHECSLQLATRLCLDGMRAQACGVRNQVHRKGPSTVGVALAITIVGAHATITAGP